MSAKKVKCAECVYCTVGKAQVCSCTQGQWIRPSKRLWVNLGNVKRECEYFKGNEEGVPFSAELVKEIADVKLRELMRAQR